MSDLSHGAGILRRIGTEHRRPVYWLVAGLVANAIVYGFLVYPLQIDVANVEQRTRDAEQALASARADHARATGTLTGKDRAIEALGTFYGSVLAPDLSGARRLTYARLADLAASSGLSYQRRTYERIEEQGSTLTRLKVGMDLAGDYADMRAFIHAIETAPEFVVIDNVVVTEAGDGSGLRMTLELSTFFRSGAA